MVTSTVENYLKEIFLYTHSQSTDKMPMGEVAIALQVTPGTATTMIKSLEDACFVSYIPRVGVRLTESGVLQATRVVRRHRLIEYFLVETLGMDWSEVHTEAEVLEHSISDRVLDRIDEHLNFPKRDPHGDPIPRKDGSISIDSIITLDETQEAVFYQIVRITDQSSKFLNFISQSKLTPNTLIEVQSIDRAGDTISLVINENEPITLGISAANKILVQAPF
jgi:DtxR family Mn-dependent transcriptional regulator